VRWRARTIVERQLRCQATRPQLKRDPLGGRARPRSVIGMNDRLNAWRALEYHDPARVLRELKVAAVQVEAEANRLGITLDPLSLRLRTTPLKKYREWRDAAIFTYGMGLAKGLKMGYATHEAEDYDFVTAWVLDEQSYFCPVQLKELPPADLNPDARIGDVIESLRKYPSSTESVLAVKLSREPELDLVSLRIPKAPFKEVYFFWQTTPAPENYILCGDLKEEPGAFEYSYPE